MADARWKMANDKSASKFASSFLSPFLLILARRRNSFISMQVHASPDPEETQRPKGRNEPKVEKLFIFFIFLILLCCCCWCCCSETSNYIHDLHTETHTHTRAHTHMRTCRGAERAMHCEKSVCASLPKLAGEFPLLLSLFVAPSLPAASLSKLFLKFKPLCERCAGNMTFKKFSRLPKGVGLGGLVFPTPRHTCCMLLLPLLLLLLWLICEAVSAMPCKTFVACQSGSTRPAC